MAALVRAQLSVQVTGDGVDADSRVEFKLQHPNFPDIAYYHLANTGVGNNDYLQKDLVIQDNRLSAADLNATILYLEINANGRDHFQGNPSISFTFNDGSVIGVNYRPFGIGTYHEANNTHQPVV